MKGLPKLPRMLVALAVVGFSVGIFEDAAAQSRHWLDGTWKAVGGVSPDSPELLNPLYLAALDSLLVVYDFGDFAVKGFRRDGSLAWRFGRKGHGPGEFEAVADLQVDQSGDIWVTDASNLRIVILHPNGQLARQVTLVDQVWSALPARDKAFFAKRPLRTPFYDRLDSTGAQTQHLQLPKVFTGLDYNQAVQNAASGRWGFAVTALRWASNVFVIDLTSGNVREFLGIDSLLPAGAISQRIKVPDGHGKPQAAVGHRIDPKASPVNEGVTLDHSYVYLLIRGAADRTRRVIDRHRLSDGSYDGSFVLPSKAAAIVRTARGFAVLVNDPTPRIDLLEWIAK